MNLSVTSSLALGVQSRGKEVSISRSALLPKSHPTLANGDTSRKDLLVE